MARKITYNIFEISLVVFIRQISLQIMLLPIQIHMFRSINRSIDLCALRTYATNYFCVFRDLYVLGTQDAEITKSL